MENATSKIHFFKKPLVQSVIGIITITLLLGGALYWKLVSSYVLIDMSHVGAPVIAIGPEAAGILSEVYVKAGDVVDANEPVARVGSETLSAKVSGIVIGVANVPGQVFSVGAPVVSMIDPNELRIIGKIDEDKGLSRIKIGDAVLFTVDAFGGTEYTGIVDEISPTSNQSSVVFSISDKREVKQFDVKVRYDRALHPEFKNGMSAKMRVYAQGE